MTKKKNTTKNTKTTKPKQAPTGFSLSSVKLKDSAKIEKDPMIDLPFSIEPDKCCEEQFEERLEENRKERRKIVLILTIIFTIALSLLTFSCSKEPVIKDDKTQVINTTNQTAKLLVDDWIGTHWTYNNANGMQVIEPVEDDYELFISITDTKFKWSENGTVYHDALYSIDMNKLVLTDGDEYLYEVNDTELTIYEPGEEKLHLKRF